MASEATSSLSADSLFETGKLYCDRGDFKPALLKLEEAGQIYHRQRDFNGYLKCQNLILRMYAEMEDVKNLTVVKERLQDLVIKENVELNSKTYYSLALCASYKAQYKTALEYLEKSLALALASDQKEDICYAIGGLAAVYFSLGRYEDALKESYNLKVFFQVLNIPELKMYALLLNGNVLRKLNQFDQALDIYWECLDLLKEQKNFYFYVFLLYNIGLGYGAMGNKELARLYLNLAKRAADPENLRYLSRKIGEALATFGLQQSDDYDLIFDAATNSIMEKKKGKIDFRNQFILLDLLRLFLKHPGEVYSKEALVKKVWKQEYDPAVHDNKIYVTIKRLRKLIEPDFDKPKYIFRAKNGYYMSKTTKILID